VFASSRGRGFTANRLFRPQRKVSDNAMTNDRLFCESLRRCIHSHIITATIERPSRTSPGALSLVDAFNLTNCPRPPPHNAVLVHCEAASMGSRERLAGRGGSVRCASAIGARPDGAARCGPAVPCGLTGDRRGGIGFGPSDRDTDSLAPGDELAATRG
jgi:hypothetical protein